jgi:hypothetical protein
MESTLSILTNYIKEFIPANKGHVIALGISSVVIGFAIWLTAHTSGLTGNLTYLALAPGTSIPCILGGFALIGIAMVMKQPPPDFDRSKN